MLYLYLPVYISNYLLQCILYMSCTMDMYTRGTEECSFIALIITSRTSAWYCLPGTILYQMTIVYL